MPIRRRKLVRKLKVTTISKGRKNTNIKYYLPTNSQKKEDQGDVQQTSNSDHCMSTTSAIENVPKNCYQKRKEKLREGWDNIRQSLIDSHVEEMCPATHECSFCSTYVSNIVYCQDCGPMAYYCLTCWQRIHSVIVFHAPQVWAENMYIPLSNLTTLSRVDGHDCGTLYTSSIYAVNGKGTQHTCMVTLCRCEEPALTLMRYHLWPSSPQKPRIAFDIRFMELLSALQLECHLPAKSFCNALESVQSDFILMSHDFPKNIYKAVVGESLMEFHYHRSSVRSRQHICDVRIGKECPICKKNPPIVSLDANFGLVHKASSGKGHGCTRHQNLFFKDGMSFKQFLDDYSSDRKSKNNECSNFQAGNIVRSKIKTAKLDVSGLFGSICKHDVPIHFIDMLQGERLGYAVYILQQLMEKHHGFTEEHQKTVVMYDIACTLHKHLQKNQRNDILNRFTFAVPVFHSFAHNMPCQLKYGQRYVDNTGLTDGEGIERLWSYLRGFKKITKEMSRDNRCDLLTEALLYHTERQIWNLGSRLFTRTAKAKTTIDDCTTIIHNVASSLNVSTASAEVWLFEWKNQSRAEKGTELSVKEVYVENMYTLSKKREQLLKDDLEPEVREIIERDVFNLDKQIKKMEKKVDAGLRTQTLSFDEESIKAILLTVVKKRRISSLQKLKQLATERQFLSEMMKKYADGQNLGKRISQQFSGNTTKMKKELDVINGLDFCDPLDFSTVSFPTSPVYSELDISGINAEQQKAAQALSLKKHALEEVLVCRNEVHCMHEFLLAESNYLRNEIASYKDGAPSRYTIGKIHYMSIQLFKIEQLWKTCEKVFQAEKVDSNMVMEIHGNLKKHLVSPFDPNQTLPVTDEEISQIFEEISELEKEEYRQMSDEDEDNFEEIDEDDEIL